MTRGANGWTARSEGGVLKVGDLSLLEHCGNCFAALGANVIAAETASAGKVHISWASAGKVGVNMRGCEAGVLQSLDRLIFRQVKHQQLCASNAEASVREVDSLLLRLDAAEGEELGQLSSSSHEGVSAVAEVVIENAVRRRGSRVNSSDSKAGGRASTLISAQGVARQRAVTLAGSERWGEQRTSGW